MSKCDLGRWGIILFWIEKITMRAAGSYFFFWFWDELVICHFHNKIIIMIILFIVHIKHNFELIRDPQILHNM